MPLSAGAWKLIAEAIGNVTELASAKAQEAVARRMLEASLVETGVDADIRRRHKAARAVKEGAKR